MTGVTIDHLVSTTVFIAAILIFISLFASTLQAAILYQQNRHISLKASDLLDTTLLNPGWPYNWGSTSEEISCFGLQQPGAAGYSLSPFALMRLLSSSGTLVYYNMTDRWYSNISSGLGSYMLVPVQESVDYGTASMLLGINGTYGFQLSITQTLAVSVSPDSNPGAPLKLKINVSGSGNVLGGAQVSAKVAWAYGLDPDGFPLFRTTMKNGTTDYSGNCLLDFSGEGIDTSKTYFAIVNAWLGGLCGTGFFTYKTVERWVGIVPFVESIEERTVLLAHSWNVHEYPNPRALFYSAAFYAFTEDWLLVEREIENATGKVNYGALSYNQTQLPDEPGILVIVYRTGNTYGISIMPWGIYTLGLSILFGDNPTGNAWVATDLRQVTVNRVAYQAKITCWSLKGYQVWNPWGGR